ncbi:hypothetical protein C4566_00835 [Candidatus Parcubacteria bacterium]|nr:MAG: hypothetical protein C4566_00835 [Candidatus Parcubacteria bacterium]
MGIWIIFYSHSKDARPSTSFRYDSEKELENGQVIETKNGRYRITKIRQNKGGIHTAEAEKLL